MKKIFAIILTLVLLASCASAAQFGLTDFKTTDMEGNEVTQQIFADYDLTIVNIWATWCGFCIEEMPALAQLKKMLPDNVNIITICDDASMEPELTREILSASGANFQTLIPTDEMYSQFLGAVYAFPTTYFLNSEGVPVVQPISGVPSLDDPAQAYLTLTEKVLDLMDK